MKLKSKIALLGSLAALALTPFAQANDGGEHPLAGDTANNGLYYPYYGYYGWVNPYYSAYSYCYLYPGLCGYYLRTSSDNFATDVRNSTNPATGQTYLSGAEEAANFLQNGGEPSESLRQAMNTEREVLLKSGIQDAKNLKEDVLASLVAARAAKPSENSPSNE